MRIYGRGLILAFSLTMVLVSAGWTGDKEEKKDPKKAKSIHEFTVKDIKGKKHELKEYAGDVVLIVNTASECGYTKQYADLVELYNKYKEKGLVVIGFPANDFGKQEPGNNEEILEFCQTQFNVEFPMMAKTVVKGEKQAPLFQYLTHAKNEDFDGEIKWNFEKFLLDKYGKLIHRYRSKMNPMDKKVVTTIEKALKQEYKEEKDEPKS